MICDSCLYKDDCFRLDEARGEGREVKSCEEYIQLVDHKAKEVEDNV